MLTPRPYLSYSQMVLFEMSPARYASQYIREEQQYSSKNMEYGSLFAEGLENNEASGDLLLDLMAARIPKHELMDIAFESDLPDGKRAIRILSKPDSYRADGSAFLEYKTSVRNWTQGMADKSGQITFYTMGFWLKHGVIPKDIELVNVRVEYAADGQLQPTGEMLRFPTKRTMVDVLKMTTRAKRAWHGIEELCEHELI